MTISENPDLTVTLTVKEAAAACGVSIKTIRRRLDSDSFPNAIRGAGPREGLEGPWLIPTSDLLAAGLSFSIPKPVQPLPAEVPTSTESPDLENLKAAYAAQAVELAHAKELLARSDASLDDARLALRALTAGTVTPGPRARRGWFRR